MDNPAFSGGNNALNNVLEERFISNQVIEPSSPTDHINGNFIIVI